MSDSSVNQMGFRLLTEGYVQEQFERNPIGFRQHDRESGVLLKWEDIAIEGDSIVGTPVINLHHPKGEQTYDEVENGFMNAASMGIFVFLEMSDDEALMLEGQKLPTVTKWYNKECSLVDMGNNHNATVLMYGEDGNEITLASLQDNTFFNSKKAEMDKLILTPEAALTLGLSASVTDQAVINGEIIKLAARASKAENDLKTFKDDLTTTGIKAELKLALDASKINQATADQLEKDYAGNLDGLKVVLAAMPSYTSITSNIKKNTPEGEAKWGWDDYQTNDPEGIKLEALKENDKERYQAIFDAKFGKK